MAPLLWSQSDTCVMDKLGRNGDDMKFSVFLLQVNKIKYTNQTKKKLPTTIPKKQIQHICPAYPIGNDSTKIPIYIYNGKGDILLHHFSLPCELVVVGMIMSQFE